MNYIHKQIKLFRKLFILIFLSVLCFSVNLSFAQTIRDYLWITDGEVRAIIENNGLIYIGGDFSFVGPKTGTAAIIDTTIGNYNPIYPGVEGGGVTAAVSDGFGGWYIGGNFTSVGGLPRNALAHFKADGTVSAWNPGADDIVYTLAISGSIIYAGGNFTNIGGQVRNRIAAIDTSTGIVNAWNPDADDRVHAIKISGSTMYVGGRFTNIGGQIRNRLAAFNLSTGIVTNWNPDADSDVYTLINSDTLIYVGGNFGSIGGQTRNFIAAIDTASGNVTAWNPNSNHQILALAISDSIVYAGGNFTGIGGVGRNRIAAIDVNTGMATAWNPNADERIQTILLSGSTVYVGGWFTSIGGQIRNDIVAIDAVTGNATPWYPATNGFVEVLEMADSKLFIGGSFSSISGKLRNSIAAIESSTGGATDWNPDCYGQVYDLSVSGSTVYVGGSFTNIGGQARNYIAAVNASTGSASTWNPDANYRIYDCEIADSTIFVCGDFTSIGGQTRNRIAEISLATGNVTAWNPDADNVVHVLSVLGDTVYAGGRFNNIGGQLRNYISALNKSTGLVTAWNPDANDWVWDIEISNSLMYTGGRFTSIGGQIRTRIAAIDLNTGSATSWNPGANDDVYEFAFADSIVYTAGNFTSVGGLSRNHIAAIDINTGDATNWNPDADQRIYRISVSDSIIYAGGTFINIGGEYRRGFAGFSPDNSAALIPVLQLSFDSLNFSQTLVGGINDLSVSIYNSGTSDLNISTKYLAGNDPAEFSIIQGIGSSIIVSGDSELVVLRFSPTSTGLKSAYFIMESDAASSPDTVMLNGIAIADTSWFPQNSGTTNDLMQVFFINNFSGWTVGYNGTILNTTDGGVNWVLQTSGTTNYLTSVFFIDSQVGWVVGNSGTILHTTNGGSDWIPQTSGITNDLNSVYFVNNLSGWVLGYEGTILYTTDGGLNWTPQTSGSLNSLNCSSFFDNQNGWIVGSSGIILHTTDGGLNWLPQSSGTTNDLISVCFENSQTGWVAGNWGTILTTTDGGNNWMAQNSGTTMWLWSVKFVDAIHGWVVGGNGTILCTVDGGINWLTQNSGTTEFLTSVNFIDVDHGWIVGNNGTILHTIKILQPWVSLSNESLEFPQTVPGSNNDLQATMYNIGNSDLNISSKTITGVNSGEFSIFQGGGASTITSGDSEQVVIRFSPTSIVPKSAWFIVISNSPSSPDTLNLIGNNSPVVLIDNTPVNDSDIGLTITPPQNYNPTITRLYYRMAGETNWQMTNLTLSGSNYVGNIDSSYTTIRGIEYYIYFDDGQTVITYPAVNPQSNPAVIQVQVDQMTSATQLVAEKYKMISVPLELADSTIGSVLVDDYGTYDKKHWRILHWNDSLNDYDEYPSLQDPFQPGFSCWLITRDALPFDVENGLSVRSDSDYPITILPGWNQIANPFAFNVAWDSIANSQLLNNPVYWDGDNYDYTQTTLQPWEGYFIYNDSSNTISISVPPRASGTVLEKPTIFTDVSLPEFIVQIIATGKQDNQIDQQNYVGMLQTSSNGFDVTDYPQAPPIIEILELSITDEDKFYAGNFKSISPKGAYWDLQLSNAGNNKDVQIEMNQMSEIPENFETWLLDLDKFKPLSITNNQINVKIINSNDKRNLRLIIGTEEFAEQVSDGIPLQPVSFALLQNYPNPFNPNTIIKYQLAEQVKVHLEIFNILGQKIKTLVQSTQNTGLHQVVWNSKNDNGRQVGSSVFIYRIQAGSFNKTRKMILIR